MSFIASVPNADCANLCRPPPFKARCYLRGPRSEHADASCATTWSCKISTCQLYSNLYNSFFLSDEYVTHILWQLKKQLFLAPTALSFTFRIVFIFLHQEFNVCSGYSLTVSGYNAASRKLFIKKINCTFSHAQGPYRPCKLR
jgi:hypothetical protein